MLRPEIKVLSIVEKIWKKTFVLKQQQSFMKNADYRVRNYITPSGGKESYKDCYIWVSYIELMREINPTAPTYFFSVNTKDFAETKESNKLHPDLVQECPSNSIGHAFDVLILHGKLKEYFNHNPGKQV